MRLGVRRQRGEQNNVFAFTSSLLCLYFLFGFLPYEESKRTEETVTLLCGLQLLPSLTEHVFNIFPIGLGF
jgi:hypothetical protein